MDLRLHVYEEGLRRLMKRNACEADRDAAAKLLGWLGAFGLGSRRHPRARLEEQGELFGLLGSDG